MGAPSIIDRLQAARKRAADARAAEDAAIVAEQAKLDAVRAAEAKAAADNQAKWDQLREDRMAAASEVVALEAEAERQRIADLWDAVTGQEALATLAERATEAWAMFSGHENGLPISVLGSVLLDQVTGVSVPAELWTIIDPPAGFMADLRLTFGGRDLEFRVVRTDGESYGVVGSVGLFVTAQDGSLRDIYTAADLGRVLAEMPPVAQ